MDISISIEYATQKIMIVPPIIASAPITLNEVIVGCILGDGHLQRHRRTNDPVPGPRTGSVRYVMTLMTSSFDYLITIHNVLGNLCRAFPTP
jgi:hypothetical protein